MPIDVSLHPESQLASVTVRGTLEGEEIWPSARRVLGGLDLARPCAMRVDLSEVGEFRVTSAQMLDIANRIEPIADRLGALRVAFITGTSGLAQKNVSEYIAARARAHNELRAFEDADEADAWLQEHLGAERE